jgi:hypothetical protein
MSCIIHALTLTSRNSFYKYTHSNNNFTDIFTATAKMKETSPANALENEMQEGKKETRQDKISKNTNYYYSIVNWIVIIIDGNYYYCHFTITTKIDNNNYN